MADLDPQSAARQGARLERQGRLAEAADLYESMLRRSPPTLPALDRLAAVCVAMNRAERIGIATDHLLEGGHDNVSVRLAAAFAAQETARHADAATHLEAALRLEPGNLRAKVGLAEVHLSMGARDKAAALIVPLIDAGRRDAMIALLFGRLAPDLGRTDDALGILNGLGDDPAVPAPLRASALFRAASLLDRLERYDDAWQTAERANALTPAAYRRENAESQTSMLIGAWTSERLAGVARADPMEPVPIIVCGLPRSGSSLIEAILASHPRIGGVGESSPIDAIVASMFQPGPTGRAPGFDALNDADACRRYADRLGASYRSRVGGSGFVVDKRLSNTRHLGTLRAIAPGARIIAPTREIRDIAVSCFMNDFRGGAPFTRDLESIAHAAAQHERLLDHWREVLDASILEVAYEDLVGDLESQTRRLLDFVGVEFDDACLSFHASDHVTATVSIEQVRRPIYGSSVGRWRNYEHRLGPLHAAL